MWDTYIAQILPAIPFMLSIQLYGRYHYFDFKKSENRNKIKKSKKLDKVSHRDEVDSIKRPVPSPINSPKEQNNKHISF